ncbi:MAG TPA: hypothetical protein VKQ30_15080 [Ktedonobacterales bacterium]|nr:hypothetical protein [Ktedonobacterales bacterium]
MPTIDESARSAQYGQSFFQALRIPRAAACRLVLLLTIVGAAYAPGVMVSRTPRAQVSAVSHAAIAVLPMVQCPGVALPC